MEWLAILIHVDADTFGYVLENEHGMYAYERDARRLVPAFRSPASAAAFVRDIDPAAHVVPSEEYELAPLRAFAAGDTDAAPDRAFDTWVVLDDIAWAARRDEALESPHDHASSLTAEASIEDREAARVALREVLGVVTDVLVHLDAGQQRA